MLENERIRNDLQADCKQCFGLCCVALYFSASEGFPSNKDAGDPCPNLGQDFRCGIHNDLIKCGLKGCAAFDCFGAGQKVSKVTFDGSDWRKVPESSKQMFEVFLIMKQLHELLWYLTEAMGLGQAYPIHSKLSSKRDAIEQITLTCPDLLMELDVTAQRAEVNKLLLRTSKLVRDDVQNRLGQTGKWGHIKTFGRRPDFIGADLRSNDLRGANLRGACLIAADLRGNDFNGTDLIGADFRDADLRGADFSKSIFLTQVQLNAAKGDDSTKLPPTLTRPLHWR